MLGYTAVEVMNTITPADISDAHEVVTRAKALSAEFATPILPGFEALVFKASRGIEDIYELTYIRKDGSRFPAVVSVTALRDAEDTIIGYLLIGTDNTARKQVEEERMKLDQRVRDQQFYTRSLLESNIDALMATDLRGIITDVNKQMEALTGCTRDELIGAPFKNYFTDPERAEAGIKLVLSEKKVTNYELTARTRDGKETVVSYNATTFYDQAGKLQGVFAGARDITEHKKLEQQLRDQQYYLRGLIESSVDGLITVDPDGFITDINDRMCQMSGYARAELLGTPFSDYFTEPERALEGVRQTLEVGSVTEYALTLVARSRRLLQVSFNASIFKDPAGSVRGILASARDITDRVRLEEQLLAGDFVLPVTADGMVRLSFRRRHSLDGGGVHAGR
jgi:PAS domain S-box-containing protein